MSPNGNNISIGTVENEPDSRPTTRNLPKDKTLVTTMLTADAPVEPEVKTGLKTEKDVYDAYKPKVTVDLEDDTGQVTTEVINFESRKHFEGQEIQKGSKFFQTLNQELDYYGEMIRQLHSNKLLVNVLENSETKGVYLSCIDKMIDEIPDE